MVGKGPLPGSAAATVAAALFIFFQPFASSASSSTSSSSSCKLTTFRLSSSDSQAWQLCGVANQSSSTCFPASVPGTILVNLIAQGKTWSGVTDPFVNDILLKTIPDISVLGSSFFSGAYTTTFTPNASVFLEVPGASTTMMTTDEISLHRCLTGDLDSGDNSNNSQADVGGLLNPYLSLVLNQINYRAKLTVISGNGHTNETIAPLGAPPGINEAVGMFQRFVFDLGPISPSTSSSSSSSSSAVDPLSIYIAVLPPDHPGNGSNTCTGCGQGGNHQIAQDVSSQYFAGWDWVGSVPDRNTGIFDDVFVRVTGAVLLRDPIAVTLSAQQIDNLGRERSVTSSSYRAAAGTAIGTLLLDPSSPATVQAQITVSALNLNLNTTISGTLTLSIPGLNLPVSTPVPITLSPGDGLWHDIQFPTFSFQNVSLWWPHTVLRNGDSVSPSLYAATINFTIDGDTSPSDSVSWNIGFRTASAAVDSTTLGGQVFYINGYKMYIEGGNWIAVDQLNRFNNDPIRYYNEVRMHKESGLNFIRLWAGAGGHGSSLYDAGDALGVMFLYEGGMSGDNNGRWAGEYSWPLDHSLYLRAFADIVRMLRGHPSVLFFTGGNELFPPAQNPPPDIAASLPEIIQALDPSGRPYIPSSMSTYNGFDPIYALAPSDGPYGMLDERNFFEKNPGLFYGNKSRAISMPMAFQPEIGSSSSPEYESMARFLSPAIREAIPPQNANWNEVNETWIYHKYLPFTNNQGVDTLYSYGAPVNASEYAFRAGLAQYRQYHGLYEGFAEHMWQWYGAVVVWKTQSPWPAFRGAFYDSYMCPTGSLWGARAATGSGIQSISSGVLPSDKGATSPHIQLNPLSKTISVLNRGLVDISSDGPFVAQVLAYDICSGKQIMLSSSSSSSGGSGDEQEEEGASVQALASSSSSSSVPPLIQPVTSIPAQSVLHLPDVLTWPTSAPPGSVLLFRLNLSKSGAMTILAQTDYWLSNLETNASLFPQNYSALDTLRNSGPHVQLTVNATTPSATFPPSSTSTSSTTPAIITVSLSTPIDAPAVAFAVRLSLRFNGGTSDPRSFTAATGFIDDRVLPIWASDNYIHLIPGEVRQVKIEVDSLAAQSNEVTSLVLFVDGWNVAGGSMTVPISVVGGGDG